LLIPLAGLACGLAATWLRPTSTVGLITLRTLLAALLGLLAAAGPLRGSAALPTSMAALVRIATLALSALAVLSGPGSCIGILAVAGLCRPAFTRRTRAAVVAILSRGLAARLAARTGA